MVFKMFGAFLLIVGAHIAFGHGSGEHSPHQDHDFEKPTGPHQGIIAEFFNSKGQSLGYLEIKLHDDKGDLELWLAKDQRGTQPFDLPLNSSIEVTFLDKSRSVTMRVRNKAINEDENGITNVRDGETNYFVFPGEVRVDTRWLIGKEFKSSIIISFGDGSQTCASDVFTLTPHLN